MVNQVIFIPMNFSIFIISNKIKYVYIQNFFNSLIIPIYKIFYINTKTNCLVFYTYKISYFISIFSSFIINYSTLNVQLVKFKGKGFKLSKKHTHLDFLFNFSHINFFVIKKVIIKKLGKSKIAIISPNSEYLNKIKTSIINIRFANVYTSNGLRLKRQIIYRRKGKTISN